MDIIQKFQDLVKKLFQFETSDLDFGIYRILNYKQDQIKKFIEEDLVNKVESAFASHKEERLSNVSQKFDEVKQKVKDTLGQDVFTPTGDLKDEFKNTPVGKEYLSIKSQKDEAKTIDEIKLQVFNDLYSFFSRFYEEGDFIPQYRYSIKGHKYAIPYNGEEVKLYWANNEQYYTKTGQLFRDYTFKANGYKVIFRIVSAREELGSNKATKERFFVLDDENPLEKAGDKTLIIRFQYRELNEKEVKSYEVEGGSNASKQEKINQNTYERVLEKVKNIELKARLSKEYKNEKPLLLYQLNRFTAKNTKDYFIHKNLKKFLSEQLDYFIKAEVLSIETLEKERFLDKHITRAKVVREIGEEIIDFLSQIEDFQKRLWEKKKFVLKTEYVITTDRVPEEFYDEIWNNENQKKEWEELGFDLPKTKEELKEKKLPIDTKYFSSEFKERLLEKITEKADLDDLLDGLLIKSENWQALNLLLGKYKEKVKCIYIDPPYNTGSDEFLYKDKYRHSSWLTMMYDRLIFAKEMLKDDGVIFISIDDNEVHNLKEIMNNVFGEQQTDCIIWKKASEGRWGKMKNIRTFRKDHDYVLVAFCEQQELNKLREKPQFKYDYNNPDNDPRGPYKAGSISRREEASDPSHPRYYSVTSPGGKKFTRQWDITKEEFKELDNDGRIYWGKDGMSVPAIKIFLNEEREITPYSIFIEKGTNTEAKEEFLNILGSGLGNIIDKLNPKPKELITTLAQLATKENSIVLDFFAGSGTTSNSVMTLNKKYNGQRKYILVEMANYFDTVIITRLKKICYSFNWKNGKPQDTDGISQFFKYQILEQYEDTLDNIELKENKQAKLKFGDDYLLKYFLDYEIRESLYLLNIDHLKNPFSYKLKVNLEEVGEPQEMVVDIPETFNYLLGLKIKKYKVRNTPSLRDTPLKEGNGRKYLFILGEKEGKNIAVVWRDYKENWSDDDFKKDKEFIIRELELWAPHIVYVNGQSILTPKLGKLTVDIRYIEPEFKRLMEG